MRPCLSSLFVIAFLNQLLDRIYWIKWMTAAEKISSTQSCEILLILSVRFTSPPPPEKIDRYSRHENYPPDHTVPRIIVNRRRNHKRARCHKKSRRPWMTGYAKFPGLVIDLS